jgi:hypothetical protein
VTKAAAPESLTWTSESHPAAHESKQRKLFRFDPTSGHVEIPRPANGVTAETTFSGSESHSRGIVMLASIPESRPTRSESK